MKNWLLFPLIVIVSSVFGQQVDRLAFGSCSFQFAKQKIWKSVVAKDPQLWVWLGDIIYSDIGGPGKSFSEKFEQADSNPNYGLLKQACPIIATWDDHDYGGNNSLGDFANKKENKQIFLDFLKAPEDDPRRNQEGVYTSYTYGEGQRKVKVILLDTRYCCQHPSAEADMLGDAQWEWLEKELIASDARLNVIGSSIQFVADVPSFENWDKFPSAQNRMLDLIGKTNAKGVVFISGDVHFTEASKRKYDQVDYPIYDFTSSGLTHGNNTIGINRNPYRIKGSRYGRHNFGFIDIDWEADKLTFSGFDTKGKARFKQDVPFSELGW
ncbi:MAG: alkaline phosphatase family protein [Flavobacteriales bacterium]|nr:alkaline phosphatase family protein [Flavobacteriales bacterium]